MLGILWKDLKVMRMQTAILTGVFLMMTVASVWNAERQDDISFFIDFSTLMPLFFTLLPCSALALEQQEQTNAWLMTLPCSRKQMVLEKYVLLLVFGLGSAAVLGIITAILTGSALSFALAMRSGILGICFQCVLLPLYYKLGFQRAKFVYMLLCALIGGVTGFLSGSDSTWLTSLHLSATLLICSIVCLVLLPISMRFSVQWMTEKEY